MTSTATAPETMRARLPIHTVLAIDTATGSVVTGIARVSADPAAVGQISVSAERAVADHRRHAELLAGLIRDVLDESGVAPDGVDAVVVGCGPGPFTGLRVGMATAAAYGDALGIPVYGTCTLDAIAMSPGAFGHDGTGIVVTDARRREVYWARYRDGRRVDGPAVTAPDVVAQSLPTDPVKHAAGSPAHLVAAGYTGPAPTVEVPAVTGLVASAADQMADEQWPQALTPLYLRRPDAVERAVAQAGRDSRDGMAAT